MRNGASAEGRAVSLKARCRGSSRSTLPGFLLAGNGLCPAAKSHYEKLFPRSWAVSMTPPMRCARMEMRQSLVSGGGGRLVARTRDQPRDLGGRNRRAEQIALHLGAAELAQQLALPFLLDAF